MTPPRRRVRLTIEVGADSWEQALDQARSYLDALDLSRRTQVIDADAPGELTGCSGLCSYRLNVDPTAPAGDEFRRELLKWAKARREGRDGA